MGGPKGKNKMRLTFVLAVVLFAAATLADECQIYRGAVEKLAVEISSRQPRPESLLLRMVFAKRKRATLAVNPFSLWLRSVPPVLALATPWVSTSVSWTK